MRGDSLPPELKALLSDVPPTLDALIAGVHQAITLVRNFATTKGPTWMHYQVVMQTTHAWATRRPESWTIDRAVFVIQYADLLLSGQVLPPLDPVLGHTLTELEQASADYWAQQHNILPMESALRAHAAADLARMYKDAVPPPHANSPFDMGAGAPPTMQPCDGAWAQDTVNEWSIPGTAPDDPYELAGHKCMVDPTALYTLHKEHCATCAAGAFICYIHSLRREVVQHQMAWKDTPPPPNEEPGYRLSPEAEAEAEAFNNSLMLQGITFPLPDALLSPAVLSTCVISTVFIVHLWDIQSQHFGSLAPNDVVGATAIACSLADMFVNALLATLTKALGPATPDGPSWSQRLKDMGAAAYWSLWESVLLDPTLGICKMKKPRQVFNLKRFLNQYLPDWPFRFPHLPEFLAYAKPGCWFAKADIKGGYYHIRMHTSMRKYLVFRIGKRLFTYSRLTMGAKDSPALFCWLTGEITAILRARGVKAVMCYIDDFLICADTEAECVIALAMLKDVCAQLNIQLDEDKTSKVPSQSITILGLHVDSVLGLVSMPMEKIVKTMFYAKVVDLCAQRTIPIVGDWLATLGGKTVWLSTPNPIIRAHTQPLTGLTMYGSKAKAMYSLHKEEHAPILDSVRWLLSRAAAGGLKGERIMFNAASLSSRAIAWTSDASGDHGSVALKWGKVVIYTRVPVLKGSQQAYLAELCGPLIAIARFGDLAPDGHNVFGHDNQGNTYLINQARVRSRLGRDLITALYDIAYANGLSFVVYWLTRWQLRTCDELTKCTDGAHARARHPWVVPIGDSNTGDKITDLLSFIRKLSGLPLADAFLHIAGWITASAPKA